MSHRIMKRILLVPLLLPSLLLGSKPAGAGKEEIPKGIGTITHPRLDEASGIVKSRTHPGVFWAISDSGNPANLYAIDRTGKLLAEYRVEKALNIDWEALAIDDKGYLYIGDVGNNGIPILFSRRQVYRVKEPNPTDRPVKPGSPEQVVAVDRVHPYTFPGKPFDVEGMFFHQGSLYLLSKARMGPTRLYRLPLDQPDRDVKLVEVCELPGIENVTDACLSPDGLRLAVCSYDHAALFLRKAADPLEKLKDQAPVIRRFNMPTNIEGCCWDGEELILVSESRQVYALSFPSAPR
jgi:hypothetical protein